MARHEGNIRAAGTEPLALEELFAMLGDQDGLPVPARKQAIACYLSGAEGWREAVEQLGGAFAEEDAGLRDDKAD